MAYNVDYSPMVNASANRANLLSGLGKLVGESIIENKKTARQKDLATKAIKGDSQALVDLAAENPAMAQAVSGQLESAAEARKQKTIGNLAEQVYSGNEKAQQDLSIISPEINQEVMRVKKADTEQRQKGMIFDFAHALNMVETGDTKGALDYLGKRATVISDRGGDPSDTLEVMNRLVNNEAEGKIFLRNELFSMQNPEAFAKMKAEGDKGIKEKGKQKTGAFLARDKETKEPQIVVGSFDPETGELSTEAAPLKGLEVVSQLGETAEEQTTRNVGEKRDIETAKGQEKLASDIIDRGVAQAESAAIIKRGLKLLQTVETGGIDSVKLAAKRMFGIEGADEGELSSSLGKAVLSQLRETFGNQFTDQEGRRLERIEASFGKSNAANIRLLQRALSIIERNVYRAKKRALERNDTETVQDLEDLMSFEINIPELEAETKTTINNSQIPVPLKGANASGNFSSKSSEELFKILGE